MKSIIQELASTAAKPRLKKGNRLSRSTRAEIYEGTFNNNTPCVIKIFQSSERYERDIKFLDILCKHVNILAPLYFYIRPDFTNPFLVFELMSEGSLLSMIHNNKIFDKQTSLGLLNDILHGLDHLHSFDVVHRDLTAEHILIDTKMRAKITGFGLAKQISTRFELDCDSMEETSEYLAPEVARNAQQFSKESDIYAFGIVLYLLASYQRPYYEQKNTTQPL